MLKSPKIDLDEFIRLTVTLAVCLNYYIITKRA